MHLAEPRPAFDPVAIAALANHLKKLDSANEGIQWPFPRENQRKRKKLKSQREA
jgi:hypothetical protein